MDNNQNKSTGGSSPPEKDPELDAAYERDKQDSIEKTVDQFLFTPRERPTRRAHSILSEWMRRLNQL